MRSAASALVLALLVLSSCGSLDRADEARSPSTRREPSSSTEPVGGAVLERVRYELVLDPSGATPIDGGFRFRSARGEDIEVRNASVTSLLATLSPCRRARASAARRTSPMRALAGLFLPAVARAGHTEASDPSELLAPRIEALGAEPSVEPWGEATFPRGRYCGVQYVATRATTPEAVGRFEELATLHAEIRTPSRELVVHTTIAGGKLATIEEAYEADATLPPSSAVVRVERAIGVAFRDVDFGLEGRELERAMMRALAGSTRLRIRMRSPTGE